MKPVCPKNYLIKISLQDLIGMIIAQLQNDTNKNYKNVILLFLIFLYFF